MSRSDATEQVRLKADTTGEIRLKADTTGEARLADTTERAKALLEQIADSPDLSPEDVRAIVSAATRLYSNASGRAGYELPPVDTTVSTTDAISLACALVRSQDLTPFEMAMWFGRGERSR